MNIVYEESLWTTPVPRETFAPWLKPRSNKVKVVRDWRVWVDGELFTVPKGYVLDWSSTPRLAWILFPPSYSEARHPAALHDYFYSHLWPHYSRRFADQVFRQMMLDEGANCVVAALFYVSVRAGFGGGWNKVRRRNAHPFWRAHLEESRRLG